MLIVTASSTDTDLTTTGALREVIFGATATSTVHDAHLGRAIRRASAWAERYIGQPLTLQSYEEKVAGYGSRRLMLSRTPIVAVDEVYDATDTGTATQIHTSEFMVENAEAGFLARDQGWPWSATLQARSAEGGLTATPLDPQPVPGEEYKPWLVRYRAGWTYGGVSTSSPNWSTEAGSTSSGRTLPEDIEDAVLSRAQVIFAGSTNVQSESLGDLSVNYRSGGADSASDEEESLAPYRRFV